MAAFSSLKSNNTAEYVAECDIFSVAGEESSSVTTSLSLALGVIETDKVVDLTDDWEPSNPIARAQGDVYQPLNNRYSGPEYSLEKVYKYALAEVPGWLEHNKERLTSDPTNTFVAASVAANKNNPCFTLKGIEADLNGKMNRTSSLNKLGRTTSNASDASAKNGGEVLRCGKYGKQLLAYQF